MEIQNENDGILVKVKFASYLKELIGKSVIELKLSENTSVGELIDILKEKWPFIKKIDIEGEGPIILLLNNKPTSRIEKLKYGDEIEIIPPAIGG
ncbi:MAG: MoaD family protein [Candidatus Methanomethylicia archaeon]